MTTRVVIIGAGASGLSAAAHLAGSGMHVTVVEKNEQAGGRCGQLEHEGHRFDTGPTLLVMPGLYEMEFAALGESMRDVLQLRRVEPTYHLRFDDGSALELTSDLQHLRRQLETIERGSFEACLRYLEEAARHYHLAIDGLVRRNFRTAGEFFHPKNLPLFLQIGALRNHYRHLGSFFKSPRLKAVFSFQDMYMGLSPFEAASTFSLMQFSELAEGVWFPLGGMSRVSSALQWIAERRGAELQLGVAVERIDIAGGRARGVTLADGSRLSADLVLATADLPYVYRDLLPADGYARRLNGKRYSCSTISFLWGIDRPVPDLPPHTLFLRDDFRRTSDVITREHGLPESPCVYVHAPVRLDAGMAPPGQDTLIAIVPVGHLDERNDQEWPAMEERARTIALEQLAKIGLPDLKAHIKFDICFLPEYWENRFNLVKGATHGLSHTLTQMGYLRPHNRHARYPNLYFAGASTHPGTGLPTAIVSGRLAAERMREEHPGLT
jgi:phytoene desaturase (3,4-didehydrolycopene-forming)